jgi:hypothetical protein
VNNESIIDRDLLKEYCRGCYAYYQYDCMVLPKYKEKMCPCIECLIKMVCQKSCYKFKAYCNID